MAEIKTERKVALVGDPNPSGVGFNVVSGQVQLKVKNDCVEQVVMFNPQEATQVGVILIQAAAQAQALAQQQMVQNLNGASKLPISG